jgi:hypothetical protein
VAMPGACLRDRINTSCLGLEFWCGARFKNHIRTIFPSGHASHVLWLNEYVHRYEVNFT